MFLVPRSGHHAYYTIYLTYECTALCTVCDLSEELDLKEDPCSLLSVLSFLFLEPIPTSRSTQPLEVRWC